MAISEEALTDIWAKDKLQRRADAEFLYNFILGQVEKRRRADQPRAYTLNVDAPWGGGKSFFLQRFRKQLEAEGHLVCFMNAWKDDHAEDPYVAIMASIDSAFAPFVKKQSSLGKAWNAAKSNGTKIAAKAAGGLVKGVAKKYLSLGPEDLDIPTELAVPIEIQDAALEAAQVGVAEIEALFDRTLQQRIDQFLQNETAAGAFRDKLQAAITALGSQKTSPLFILVDELDRCRPSYAVALLERVKHLFEVDGIVFVFATNSSQLRHSIAGAYGPAFDGYMYLKRFFDRTYVFADPSDAQLIDDWSSLVDRKRIRAPFGNLTEIISKCRQAYNLDLRSTHQIIDMIDATLSVWRHQVPVEACLLVPVCITFHLTGDPRFSAVDQSVLEKVGLTRTSVDHRNMPKTEVLNLQQIFAGIIAVAGRMEDAIALGREDAQSDVGRYVYNVFVPEWDGQPLERNAPSRQLEIQKLVGSAGRLSES